MARTVISFEDIEDAQIRGISLSKLVSSAGVDLYARCYACGKTFSIRFSTSSHRCLLHMLKGFCTIAETLVNNQERVAALAAYEECMKLYERLVMACPSVAARIDLRNIDRKSTYYCEKEVCAAIESFGIEPWMLLAIKNLPKVFYDDLLERVGERYAEKLRLVERDAFEIGDEISKKYTPNLLHTINAVNSRSPFYSFNSRHRIERLLSDVAGGSFRITYPLIFSSSGTTYKGVLEEKELISIHVPLDLSQQIRCEEIGS